MDYILLIEYFKELLRPTFSNPGSSQRQKEEETFLYWLDYLDEVEGTWLL